MNSRVFRTAAIAAVMAMAAIGIALSQANPFKYNGLSYTSTGVTFANLGLSAQVPQTNGTIVYCSDCTNTLPCAGSGTGAIAQRVNGSWNCLAGATGTVSVNPLINGQAGATLNGLAGAKVDGSDNLTGFNINNVVNPITYGAKCDGATDDSTAFQAALNHLGGSNPRALYIPVSTSGCVIGTLLTYTTYGFTGVAVSGAAKIFGDGPSSKLLCKSATGCLLIQGGCASSPFDRIVVKDFDLYAEGAVDTGYGLKSDGTTGEIDNVRVLADAKKFTTAFDLRGFQQSRFSSGFSKGNATGLRWDECHNTSTSGYAGSNGGSVVAFSSQDLTIGVDLEGGDSDTAFVGTHIVGPASGVTDNRSGAHTGGCGPINFTSLHTESAATIGVLENSSCQINLANWNDYNVNSLHVANGGGPVAWRSGLADGTIVLDATPNGPITLEDLCIFGTVTNNAGAGNLFVRANDMNCSHSNIPGTYGVGSGIAPAALATFGTCSATNEGMSGTETNSTGACSAGATATNAGTTHCQIYCNGTNWIQTGR